MSLSASITFALVAMAIATPVFADNASSVADHDESWRHYGGDAGGRRYSPHVQIDRDNVRQLDVAWIYRTGDRSDGSAFPGKSTFKATPVYDAGVLYLSTPFNRVIAIKASNGEPLWTFDPAVDFSRRYAEMFTSRGVSLWIDAAAEARTPCRRRVILGTLDARLFALDAANGSRCAEFGGDGEIDLRRGIENFRKGQFSVTSPPAIIGDIIVVGSSVGDNGKVDLDHGNVRAFDARSGQLLWDWDPVPRKPGMPGYETWNREGARRTGAANAWSIMSTDADRQLVFVPTTSPSPDFYGGVRPGDNLYANSVVALHAKTGEPAWHFQTVHHDLWDYDLAAQPLLTRIRRPGGVQDVVVQAAKTGFVFVLDRDSGRPVFPVEERPAPQSDVPGEQASRSQPVPVLPPPLHPEKAGVDDIWAYTPQHAAYCLDLLSGLRNDGLFTPPSLQGTFVYPGNPGGANWGSMAVHEDRQIALVVIRRWPTIVTLLPRADYRRQARTQRGGPLDVQFTAQEGAPYGMKRHAFFNPENGLPCLRGPWGSLVAIDLASGAIRWQRPVGVLPELADHPEASQWGTLPSGGPIVTASGIVFAATDNQAAIFAYDVDTGQQLWRGELPAAAQATPMSYMAGGRQYLLVTAGGAEVGTDLPGDHVVAFRLAESPGPTPP